MAQSKLAVLAVTFSLRATSKTFLDAFRSYFCVEPSAFYLVAMSSSVIALVDTVGVSDILDGADYDMATAIMAWELVRSIEWMAVRSDTAAQLLSLLMGSNNISIFAIDGATRLLQDGKESFLTQSLPFLVPYLRAHSSWASLCHTVAQYVHCTHQQPLFIVSKCASV